MAQISIVKAAVMVAYAIVALTAFASTASAQAQAPAPAPDTGAAFSLPVSGAAVAASLLFSAVALLRR
ncbi:hypothetical protein C2S51_003000 [Perilla frutescens var. frutescens]|nr:hypothetical protein C2S51_003000 [Perilla frutescens var. frutescens]